MSQLSPCPSCHRHVRVEETVCPFCSAALPERAGPETITAPRARLSRAALFAAGATLLGAAACSSSSNNGNTDGVTGGTHQDGAAGTGGHDGGNDAANDGAAGTGGQAGSDAGTGGHIAIYSAAFPPLTPKA